MLPEPQKILKVCRIAAFCPQVFAHSSACFWGPIRGKRYRAWLPVASTFFCLCVFDCRLQMLRVIVKDNLKRAGHTTQYGHDMPPSQPLHDPKAYSHIHPRKIPAGQNFDDLKP